MWWESLCKAQISLHINTFWPILFYLLSRMVCILRKVKLKQQKKRFLNRITVYCHMKWNYRKISITGLGVYYNHNRSQRWGWASIKPVWHRTRLGTRLQYGILYSVIHGLTGTSIELQQCLGMSGYDLDSNVAQVCTKHGYTRSSKVCHGLNTIMQNDCCTVPSTV